MCNNVDCNRLWRNETILIPRLGQSAAQTNPVLPSDNHDYAAGLESLDDWPDTVARDYNELAAGRSKGIGYVDLPDT